MSMLGCRAMMREATFYSYPGRATKYHLEGFKGMALCRWRILLVKEMAIVVNKRNAHLVCKRCASMKTHHPRPSLADEGEKV